MQNLVAVCIASYGLMAFASEICEFVFRHQNDEWLRRITRDDNEGR